MILDSLLKFKFKISNTLFFGLFVLIILCFFDHPFYNSLVTFSFWIIGFMAIRWSQLASRNPDQVDTKENLIWTENLRKVPFVQNQKKEEFK